MKDIKTHIYIHGIKEEKTSLWSWRDTERNCTEDMILEWKLKEEKTAQAKETLDLNAHKYKSARHIQEIHGDFGLPLTDNI